MKAEKTALAAHRKLSAAEYGQMLDEIAPVASAPVESKVVRAAFGKGTGLPSVRPAVQPAYSDDDVAAVQSAMITDLSARRAAAPAAPEDTPRDRFKRALELERRLDAGEAVTTEQQRMLSVYQTTPEYLSERSMWEGFGDAYFG